LLGGVSLALWFLKKSVIVTTTPLSEPPRLLQHAVNLVLVIEFEGLGSGGGVDALPVEEETEGRVVDALAGRVRLEHLRRRGLGVRLGRGLGERREGGGER